MAILSLAGPICIKGERLNMDAKDSDLSEGTCPGSVAAVPLALPGCFRGCCRSGAAAGSSSGGRPLHRLAAASSRHWAPVRAAARLQPGAAMLSRVVGGREL